MISRIFYIAVAALILTSVYGENLLPNSSFELGTAGYGVVCYRNFVDEMQFAASPVLDPHLKIHGKGSLYIPEKKGDRFKLIIPEILIKPNTPYTFSGYFRSSRPLEIRATFVAMTHGKKSGNPVNKWWSRKKNFEVTEIFQRFLFTIPAVPADYDRVHVFLEWENGDLWCDAFQLEAISSTSEYHPAAPIEFSLDHNIQKFEPGKQHFTLRAINYTSSDTKGNTELKLLDLFEGKTLRSIPLTVETPAKGIGEVSFSTEIMRNGLYRLDGQIVPPLQFGVYHDHNRKLPEREAFAIGISGTFEPLHETMPASNKRGALYENGTQEQRLAFLRGQGIGILRLHDDVFSWPNNNPAPGVYHWEMMDRAVDLARKHNLRLLPILATRAFLGNKERTPDWFVYKKSIKKPARINKSRECALPDIKDWTDYITAFAERYKGRITTWEVMNEPDLYLQAEDYVPYLVAAYKALKNVDQNNIVIGFTVTEDSGQDCTAYMQQCINLDALRYCDEVAFHPYGSTTDNSPMPAEKLIRTLNTLISEAGYSKKLINTELYFVRTINIPNGCGNIFPPENLMRRYLIDLGEGCTSSISLYVRSCIGQDLNPAFKEPSYNIRRLVPNKNTLVNNTFSEIFEGAAGIQQLTVLPCGMNGYLYKLHNGKVAAAFWSRENRNPYYFTVPKKMTDIEFLDFTGNQLEPGKKLLSERANFLIGKDIEAINTALRKCGFVPKEGVSLLGYRHSVHKGKPVLVTEWRNNTGRPQQLRLRTSEMKQEQRQEIRNGVSSVFLPAPTNNTSRLFRVADKRVIETKLSMQPIKTAPSKIWNDCSGRFRFKGVFNQEALFLEIEVKDTSRIPKAADLPWLDDCIELFIDRNPNVNLNSSHNVENEVFRLFFTPPALDGSPEKLQPLPGASPHVDIDLCKFTYNSRPNGYRVLITVPWKALKGGRVPEDIALDVAVDDGNNGDRIQTIWSGDGKNYLYRNKFGFLVMSKK